MRYLLCVAALAVSAAAAAPDLVAPFDVVLKGSGVLLDTVIVRTALSNNGLDSTVVRNYAQTALVIGVDSLGLKSHVIPAFSYLKPGGFVFYFDTLVVWKKPHAYYTLIDPLNTLGQGGGEKVNDVVSLAYDFHPQVTMVHDTTRITLRDTLRIHDTTAVHDTVRACTTPARPAAKTSTRSRVYSLDGAFIREDVSP